MGGGGRMDRKSRMDVLALTADRRAESIRRRAAPADTVRAAVDAHIRCSYQPEYKLAAALETPVRTAATQVNRPDI